MKKSALLTIRIEPELKAAIERAAAADERSVAQWLLMMVRRELAVQPCGWEAMMPGDTRTAAGQKPPGRILYCSNGDGNAD